MARQARVLPFGSRRQILSPIDIRTGEERRGLSESQRNIQAITGILQLLGQAEQKRRERQQLDRVARALDRGKKITEVITALDRDKTITEVINAIQQEPEFSGGPAGILQRVGGAFQPQAGGGVGQNILQTIIGQGLRQAGAPKPLLTQPEQREAALVKGGLKPRAKAETPIKRKGFSLSEQKTLKASISTALDTIESQVKKTAIKGFNKRSQADLAKAYKNAALEAGYETWTEDQRKQFDRKWDRLARAKFNPRKAISKETGKQIQVGWNPNSPEVKQARRELRTGTTQTPTREITDTDVRLQSAPDVRLDEFWADLSTEEKKEIIQKLDENPDNIDEILRILQSG